MAQFIKILNQNDEHNIIMDHHHHQTPQFFNVNPNPERQQQIQYIVTDNNTQFQPQLLITTNQIMELNNSPQQQQQQQQQQQPQQQIQRIVINQSPNYQTTNNSPQQQYTSIIQQSSDNMNNHQTVQQLYYMDSNNQSENVQAAVIEQTNNQPIQTAPQQPQQIILNHQLGQIGSNLNLCNRITIPNVQRRVNHVRPPMRPVNISVGPRMSSPRPQMRNHIGTFTMRAPTSIQQLSLRALQQAQQRKSPVPEESSPSVELEDHDAAMNSIPGQISGRGQIFGRQPAKVPILSRLPGRRVTISGNQHHQLPQQVEGLTHRTRPILVPYSIEDDVKESKNFPKVSSRPQVRLKPDITVNPQNLEKIHQIPLPESQRENVKVIPIINSSTGNSVGYSNISNSQQQQQQQKLDNHQHLLQLAAEKPSTQEIAAMNSSQLTQQPNNNSPLKSNNRGNQLNYIITPPTQNSRPQQPLPPCISPTQIQHILENFTAEEYSDSIRMLVLLENGEKRLITFTLSKEACSIQEILELVQVPFTPETNIQITEINTNGVKYVVTVGNVPKCDFDLGEDEKFLLDNTQEINKTEESSTASEVSSKSEKINDSQEKEISPTPPPRPPTPPKLIPGKLAVCLACGYTGEDFNKCSRCQRKLPADVKSIDANSSVTVKKAAFKAAAAAVNIQLGNSSTPSSSEKSNLYDASASLLTTTTTTTTTRAEFVAKYPTVRRKIGRAAKQVENESVVISSDEEEPEPKSTKSVSEQILNKLGASISISRVTKEPSISEIKRHVRKEETESSSPPKVEMYLKCRTVRIGSYRFAPISEVYFDSKCIRIIAPVIDKTEIKTIRIDRCDMVKILICYNKALPVIFYYLNSEAAPLIREMLSLNKEKGIYFDPLDEKEDSYRKITLLPEDPIDDVRSNFEKLYSSNAVDELTLKEANEILIKACPKDMNVLNNGSLREIEHLLMYPKEGPGRLSINTEDFVCLAVDQFLNDKIIDFYLMYLWENLPKEQREKIHIFSTFFYKRLTTKATKAAKKSHPYETDASLSAAEKRHWRVKNWTKRTNLFEKDFIVVPINENAHWFLAIICFPALKGAQTFDGKPYNAIVKPKKVKPKIGPELKKEKVIPCDDPISDKDEAESEDSDMESDVSEESTSATSVAVEIATEAGAVAAEIAAEATVPTSKVTTVKVKAADRPPIKQPCVLIFDSLAGPSRCRVVATLRDYLTVEYKVKTGVERVFNRDNIKGASCKVPQQTNFTDCGLYLLQYVEQFFKNPLKDYSIPVKGIQDWFDEIIVTKKREDISNLIKDLMIQDGHDINVLPNIALPTANGKLIERRVENEDNNGEDEQEDMFTDIEDSEIMDDSAEISPIQSAVLENDDKNEDNLDSSSSKGEMRSHSQNTPPKPSRSMGEHSDILAKITPSPVKPSLSELPAKSTTNKDTLSYLKAKRIVRHNKQHTEEPDMKKSKLTEF